MAENRPHQGNRRERLAGRLKPAAEHRNKNVLPHIRIFHNLWFSRKMLLTRRCREIALCGSPVMVAKLEVQRVLLVLRQGWAHHVHEEVICAVAINWISYQSSDFPKQEKKHDLCDASYRNSKLNAQTSTLWTLCARPYSKSGQSRCA
ncbi:MAG: hypothetical protein MR959_00570 [Selenomonas bovis]|nr:hypothetical protein [Selenomonas bovis]